MIKILLTPDLKIFDLYLVILSLYVKLPLYIEKLKMHVWLMLKILGNMILGIVVLPYSHMYQNKQNTIVNIIESQNDRYLEYE